MNNEILKNAVAQVIKENGNEEITGNILQQVLIAMINSLGLGFQFIGEAKPGTNPGTPDARVFYFAQDAGTYSNFDGLVLDGSSVAVFLWSDEWAHIVVNIPTTPGLDARYLRIANLASSTGASTTTAMTQKAVTDALSAMLETITTALGNKVDKEPGKGLSSNDYTTQEKQKLATLPTNTQLQETLNTKADKDTTAVVGNLAKFNADGNPVDSGISAADIITRQELNPDACRGLAEAVIDTDGEGTRQEFTFRKSGGDGGAFYRRILGKTLVWNQLISLVPSFNYGGITFTNNGDGSLTLNGTADRSIDQSIARISTISGHKYLIKFKDVDDGTPCTLVIGSTSFTPFVELASKEIRECTGSATDQPIRIAMSSGAVLNNVRTIPQIFDLTLIFGAGNEPSTVAEFEALYPGIRAYNPGALISNDAVRVETVGFNQWDEEWELGGYNNSTGEKTNASNVFRSKNHIPCFPKTNYYIKWPSSLHQGDIVVLWYDKNKNYLNKIYAPSGSGVIVTDSSAYYFTFYLFGTTYNHDICVNLSDPAKNGTYEPYWKRVLQLGLNSLEIKDSQGNISTYGNGLKSTPTGIADEIVGETFINRVVRRPHIAADDTDTNVFTDGVNTDAPLATPVEYTLVNPIAHCIKVDEGGTEQAVQPENAALPSAPFSAIATYTMSIQRMVAKLRSL